MSEVNRLLDVLWECYSSMNSQVPQIHGALQNHGEKEIVNDHIAFRTFSGSEIGLDFMRKPFEDLGWRQSGEYFFKEKKLRAIHLELANAPKIFLSELLLDQCSDNLQKIIANELVEFRSEPFDSALLTSGRWQNRRPNLSIYENLLSESEYAAWLYIFGICPNHFTVFVNSMQKFSNIDELNAFLLEHGFIMNEIGGIVKGTAEDGLRQSSTMASKVSVTFDDASVHSIPCCYYEFAERFNVGGKLFHGFVTASADKIFQSTDSK